ncbi:RNA polymerase sigma factor [Gracilimonas mengyeensis]|uniref:RNA polymerase sigma factor n=1 Tax=Gracilimonas mengyeensis TaxID=1302730 RepID=A0A521E4B4_9BACT|nr:RNA polymerase sigma factor [Gracilimonas mengyeensis]SMO78705.1 RNA polymerase sigma-70 factor, ECF subfamily [Gracilimonas mengyeensis]
MSQQIPITKTDKGFIENPDFITRLTQGDEAAFKTLVNDYKDRVYNTCLGFLKNPHDAEDVAQEVFIQVYDSIGDFREEAELSTWIYRIAVTKSLELQRYRKRKKRSGFFQALNAMFNEPDEAEDESGFMHPGLALENKERGKVLFREIDKLTEKQRVAFTLHKVEGLSYKEVAKVMELKLPAVESLIHRAKQNLQKGLASYYQQNEID